MHAINPINIQNVSPHIGKSACVVLQNGTCYYGTISGIDGGRLLLNGATRGVYTLSTNVKKAQSQLLKKQNKSKTSAFGYGGFGYGGYGGGYGGAYALDLALITLLFLIPFFWI